MKQKLLWTLLLLASNLYGQEQEQKLLIDEPTSWEHAPTDYVVPSDLVRGAAFIDRILPMPVKDGQLRSDVWGERNVIPRCVENGIEDPEWSFWCRSVHKEADGKYHLFGARWPESKGFDAWPTSRVYHAVSDSPTGPFIVVTPDIGRGHNVTCFRAKDGSYIISGLFEDYIAPSVYGPWRNRKIPFDFRGGSCPDDSNNTYTSREDGSVLMINQPGRVWISEDGLKPFRKVTDSHGGHPCTLGIFEDPIIWRDEVQYNVIYNDWYGRTAYYLRSKDGVNWVWDQGIAYDVNVARHPDGSQERWYKYERPSILQDEYGRATHIYFAVIDSRKDHDKPNDKHNTKNIALPLIVQRRLEIVGTRSVIGKTKLRIKILAEPGFSPQTDVDVASLHFGAPSAVDRGKGLKASHSKAEGKDLVVTFTGDSAGFSSEDFVGKLLGSDSNGQMLFGFVRLPEVSFNEPILNANRPLTEKDKMTFVVENFGQVASQKGSVRWELQSNVALKKKKGNLMLSSIPAYGCDTISVPIDLSVLNSGEMLLSKIVMDGGGVPFVHKETFQKIARNEQKDRVELTLLTSDWEKQKGPFVMATGKSFEKGIALSAPSTTTWLLDDDFDELHLSVGAAQGALGGSVLEIWGDGKLLHATPLLRPKSIYKEEHRINIPIKGVKKLSFAVNRFFVEDRADVTDTHVIVGNPLLLKKE